MILDTNAISALFAGDISIKKSLMGQRRHHLPVIVSGEFRFGMLGSAKRTVLEELLTMLERESHILTVTTDTTTHYANIRHQLKLFGTPIPENDIWIAALASQHQLPVLSRDSHFDAVKTITRIFW